MLEIKDICFERDHKKILDHISFKLDEEKFTVITGPNGSGKSTLLNVLSGLDTYEEGEMYINGMETSHYSNEEAEHYRKSYIGNIFQSFNLVSSYTVYQNIELVLLLNGFKKKDIKNKVIELIKEVDLYKYRNSKVSFHCRRLPYLCLPLTLLPFLWSLLKVM